MLDEYITKIDDARKVLESNESRMLLADNVHVWVS